jgi:hypothetical protein
VPSRDNHKLQLKHQNHQHNDSNKDNLGWSNSQHNNSKQGICDYCHWMMSTDKLNHNHSRLSASLIENCLEQLEQLPEDLPGHLHDEEFLIGHFGCIFINYWNVMLGKSHNTPKLGRCERFSDQSE